MSSVPTLPYAIDFEVVACGKAIPNSKRRIRWRYGFADSAALAAGKTGAECRGEEHDVTLVWSVYSGKSVLLADGEELHFNPNTAEGTEHSWSKGGHLFRVTASGQSYFGSNSHYSFSVDGNSYSTFTKLIKVGTSGSGHQKTAATSFASNPAQEDAQLRQAAQASIAYDSNPAPQNPPQRRMTKQASQLLIDFFDDFDTTGNTLPPPPPTPPSQPPTANANPWTGTAAPAPTAVNAAVPTNPFGATDYAAAAPINPFEAAGAPTPAAPAADFDFFSAQAPANGPPAPPQAAAQAQAPPNFDPFSAF